MAQSIDLSDKALAVFAFAAYHQLGSGQAVRTVVRDDRNGPRADDEAVEELTQRALASVDGNDIRFSEDGLAALSRTIEGLKSAVRSGDAAR